MQRVFYAAILGLFAIALTASSFAAQLFERRRPSAQSPGLPETDAEKRGEALFWKDCSLCHVDPSSPRYNHRGRKTLGIVASTDLTGLHKRSSITDARVREVIEEGISGKMPAFKYTYALKPGAVDQLIAYLKIR